MRNWSVRCVQRATLPPAFPRRHGFPKKTRGVYDGDRYLHEPQRMLFVFHQPVDKNQTTTKNTKQCRTENRQKKRRKENDRKEEKFASKSLQSSTHETHKGTPKHTQKANQREALKYRRQRLICCVEGNKIKKKAFCQRVRRPHACARILYFFLCVLFY